MMNLSGAGITLDKSHRFFYLEIVYNVIDEQTIKVFHAMKCRNSYYAKLRMK
jgi:hypothetical protein